VCEENVLCRGHVCKYIKQKTNCQVFVELFFVE
jgi:hypothetical protein